MFTTAGGLYLLAVCRVENFWDVSIRWGDNAAYLDICSIIRNWQIPGVARPSFFWGLPYTIVGVATLLRIPDLTALVVISALSSLLLCIWVQRLYGGWVAATLFLFINYRWIFISLDGGSEPLFMCLLYLSFVLARRERWSLAALVAALSTTVRPVGIFALVSFAAVLAMRRELRQISTVALLGSAVGVAYAIPVWLIVGNPLANLVNYREYWGPHGFPVTYPFVAIISSFPTHDMHWPVVGLSVLWVTVALASLAAMWLPRYRDKFRPYPAETLFATIYVAFILSYSYDEVFLDLPRFLLPVFPLLLYSLSRWIPKNRRFVWGSVILSALLASAAMVGFRNVFGFKLP